MISQLYPLPAVAVGAAMLLRAADVRSGRCGGQSRGIIVNPGNELELWEACDRRAPGPYNLNLSFFFFF